MINIKHLIVGRCIIKVLKLKIKDQNYKKKSNLIIPIVLNI